MTTPASSVRLRRLVDDAVDPRFETLFAMLDLARARQARCPCAECAAASAALLATVRDPLSPAPDGSPEGPPRDRR